MIPKKATTFIAIVVSCSMLLIGMERPAYAAATSPAISAASAVLIDNNTKRIIYSKRRNNRRAPASTTKVLTSIVALDHLSLSRVVTIPKFVNTVEPSKAHLRPGEKYRVRDLLKATLISSANDAAEVLGYAVAGSRSKFSKIMNRKAKLIGCKRSRFIRPSGLPAKGQYSTAYDLALIMKYAQKYPFIVETLKQKRSSIRSLGGRRIKLKNHNKMLWKDSREVVGKTGWTRRAKHCFVGRMNVYGKKIFVAMMGSRSLWHDLAKLLDYQFGSNFRRIKRNQKIWGTKSQAKKVQRALKRAGYDPGPIDGQFGSRTVRAIERFQAAKGLKTDGIAGPKTWRRLRAFA